VPPFNVSSNEEPLFRALNRTVGNPSRFILNSTNGAPIAGTREKKKKSPLRIKKALHAADLTRGAADMTPGRARRPAPSSGRPPEECEKHHSSVQPSRVHKVIDSLPLASARLEALPKVTPDHLGEFAQRKKLSFTEISQP